MPSDSWYDRMDKAEDDAREKRKREMIESFGKMTMEEKVDFLIKDHITKNSR